MEADLISQEVEELEALINLSRARISLLKELQSTVASGHDLALPKASAQLLREKMPLLSSMATESDTTPTAAAEDYLVSKAVIAQEEEVRVVKFLPLRSPRSSSSSSSSGTSQSTLPSVLLVAAQVDGTIRLFSPSGDLVLRFTSGHDLPLEYLAVSPSHDEYLLATADAGGAIRVHKVSVRSKRLSKEEKNARKSSLDEKVSQHWGSTVNVTVQLHRQMQVPLGSDGEAPRLTCIAVASQAGSKYYVAGDTEGKLSIFSKNGTFRGTIDVTRTPGSGIEGLFGHLSSLLVRADGEWGYVELESLDIKRVDCPNFEGRVRDVVVDSQQSSRILVADESGVVWGFTVKNKKECTFDMRAPSSPRRLPLELASIRGYVIGLERAGVSAPASLLALNMTGVKKKGAAPHTTSLVWRKSRPAVRSWAVHRRHQQGDLLAILSEDGQEIEIMELLMQVQSAPVQDSFQNFKLPVIGVAVVMVLGYQYVKQKGKFGGGGGGGGGSSRFGGEDLASALKKRKGLGGLKGKRF